MQPASDMPQTSRHTPQTPAWVLDLLLGVAVTLVIALVISAQQGGRQPADALAYLFAAVFGALMLLRRRFPVAVMVATMLLLFTYYIQGYPAIGLAVPVVAAMYSAAERGRLRAAIVVSLILVAVSTYYRLRDGESVAYLLGYDLVSTVALLAATIALGDSTRARRELRAEQANIARLIEQEQRFRAEQRLQAERMRIARDLHDTVGHCISVISLHADVAREALGRSDDDVRRALAHVRAASSELMRELRATVKLLRAPADAPTVRPAGSLAQLPALVEQTGVSGLRLEIRRRGDDRPLPAGIDAAAYRIVQEAVTNVLRHAGATEALIWIAVDRRELRLEIADNGGAARGVVAWGAGLAGMAERAQACGGTLAAGPSPSGGFVVRATLPLGEEL